MSFDLVSRPSHDFWLTLDVGEFFEKAYDPVEVFEGGFARPLRLGERDVLAVVRWNENPEEPVFHVDFPDQDSLSGDEEVEARKHLGRILGTELDVTAFAEHVAEDPVLSDVVQEHRGYKRIARSDFYEDAIRYVIHTRISHLPTAKGMVEDVCKTWGRAFEWRGHSYYCYPRPEVLANAEPEEFREYGVSKRKGEYLSGMAREIVDGELDLDQLEAMSPEDFYERVQQIRGIGPTTAETLMLRRNRNDGFFPSQKSKGKERGIRRWILQEYGHDPHQASEDEWQSIRDRWRGFESLVSSYLYYSHLMAQKERAAED